MSNCRWPGCTKQLNKPTSFLCYNHWGYIAPWLANKLRMVYRKKNAILLEVWLYEVQCWNRDRAAAVRAKNFAKSKRMMLGPGI
jgi:hypothetical protein